MQILSAPTRSALDKAHAKRKWLDIGVVSLRNLWRISNKRRALWSLYHLYRSTCLLTSISVNEYGAISVTKTFITSPPTSNFTSENEFIITEAQYLRNLTAAGKLEELDPRSCLDAYASKLQTSRGRVLVVTTSSNESYVGDSSSNDVGNWFYSWICGDDFGNGKPCSFHLDAYRRSISTWRPFEQNVEYCLSERLEENCKLNTSVPIAILVTVLNVIKVMAMVLLAFWIKEEPILTIGDAIASYLERKDLNVEGMCLLSKRTVKKRGKNWSREPIPYKGKRQRWHAAISGKSWFFYILLYILTVILLAIFFHLGITRFTHSSTFSDILSLGPKPHDNFTSLPLPRHGTASLLVPILLANVGQSILSFLYITYNNLVTTMSLAHEWSSFSSSSSSPSSSSSLHKPKSLRVSQTPHGSQKSTYFLQLPYRFALPLMGFSALIHWLLSQSIFLISIEKYSIPFRPSSPTTIYNQWQRYPRHDVRSCGYSPLAIILVMIVGLVMMGELVVLAGRKLGSGMSVVGSCSVAIAAGCAGAEADGSEGVVWGVIVDDGDGDGVGRCGFSNGVVGIPRVGGLYT